MTRVLIPSFNVLAALSRSLGPLCGDDGHGWATQTLGEKNWMGAGAKSGDTRGIFDDLMVFLAVDQNQIFVKLMGIFVFLWKGSDFELLADNKKPKTAIFDDIFETIDGWWFCECFVASAEASHSFGFRPSVPLSEESLRGGCFHPGGEISQDMIGLWGSRLETHLSLVVWNICFSIIYGIILPIDFHIFQDGYCTSNQIKFQQSLFVV